jgi:acetolactate synthase-1/2/3 large subunit
MKLRGADVVARTLAAAGVRHVFALSGNHVMPVFDAALDAKLSLIHVRHEAAAVHMADAWGRLTETPGVTLVTAAPGHLNAVSALYGALMAESPLVLLSGHAPLGQLGRGAFQEMDQVTAARPVTKAAWLARDPDHLGDDIARALAIAASGRPGPVHVSLPGDVLEARGAGARPPAPPAALPPPPPPLADPTARTILGWLAAARRPLILVGPAMARASRWARVQRFSARTGIPALVMESPRGVSDPQLRLAALRLPEADLVLLLGKRLDFALRFGEAPAFATDCRFVQLDADPAALRPGGRVLAAVQADPALAVDQLDQGAAAMAWRAGEWKEQVAAARRAEPAGWAELRRSTRRPLHPLRVCAAVQPLLDRGAILVADGGEFGQWAQAGLEADTRLINGLSGSIGSAIPMACAAKLARPERDVVALVGDGTFGFHGFELDTAVRHGWPVLVVVGNDGRWNAEHQLQIQQYGAGRTVGCELGLVRYDRVTEALGGHGEFVEEAQDMEPALARALRSGRAACVNAVIDGLPAPTYRAAPAAH